MNANSLNHFKSVMCFQFFVKPADQNYLIARLMRIYGFHSEYNWQAAQALEKYMKAGLALNDRATKNLSHGLTALYVEFQKIFGPLTPLEFVKPQELSNDLWVQEPVTNYLKRVDEMGSPDSRYGLISWFNSPCDLFKLDQIVYAIRRVLVGLDWIVGTDWEITDPVVYPYRGHSFKHLLHERLDFQCFSPITAKQINTNSGGDNLADVMHAWNYAFKRYEADTARQPIMTVHSNLGPFKNSYLFLLWELLNNADTSCDPYLKDGVEWLIRTVRLPKGFEQSFKELKL